jgi:hypothetical protein
MLKKSLKLYLLISLIFIFISFQSCTKLDEADQNDQSLVDVYGQIMVSGNQIVDQNNRPITLHGMSLFWSQWMGKYYNYDCIKWLRDDWKCTVIRAALGIESGGYLDNPETGKARIIDVVDACIDSTSVEAWCDFMDQNMISWCNWSIADKAETAATLLPSADPNGGWSDSDLSKSGMLIRQKLIEWYDILN